MLLGVLPTLVSIGDRVLSSIVRGVAARTSRQVRLHRRLINHPHHPLCQILDTRIHSLHGTSSRSLAGSKQTVLGTGHVGCESIAYSLISTSKAIASRIRYGRVTSAISATTIEYVDQRSDDLLLVDVRCRGGAMQL